VRLSTAGATPTMMYKLKVRTTGVSNKVFVKIAVFGTKCS